MAASFAPYNSRDLSFWKRYQLTSGILFAVLIAICLHTFLWPLEAIYFLAAIVAGVLLSLGSWGLITWLCKAPTQDIANAKFEMAKDCSVVYMLLLVLAMIAGIVGTVLTGGLPALIAGAAAVLLTALYSIYKYQADIAPLVAKVDKLGPNTATDFSDPSDLSGLAPGAIPTATAGAAAAPIEPGPYPQQFSRALQAPGVPSTQTPTGVPDPTASSDSFTAKPATH